MVHYINTIVVSIKNV